MQSAKWEEYNYLYKVFLIAHEIGHHYFEHTYGHQRRSCEELEWQANLFAGYVLHIIGASHSEATNIFQETFQLEIHPK